MNIAITGLGAVSACGLNLKETMVNFSLGKRQAGEVTLFKTDLKYPVFEAKRFIPEDNKYMRTLSLAFCAIKEAIIEANLTDFSMIRLGICLGTTVASQLNDVDFYKEYRKNGSAPVDAAKRFLESNLALAVKDYFHINTKFCCTLVNACSSGTDAIGLATSWLRNDYCDIAIAGGADELNRVPLDGFNSLGVVSNSLCTPFDRDRSGLNLGEGSGIVILEKEESALKRNRTLDLFFKGYGLAADGHHLTAPHPEGRGLERALDFAMHQADIKVDEVAFINAHGTATRDNDKVEGRVFRKVFGENIKFVSTKGFTGHTLGAAGGLEAVFTCLGLRYGWIPKNVGFTHMDEQIGIAPVGVKTDIKGRYAISTSLAFGGNNSVLVIARN